MTNIASELRYYYKRAFKNAVELFIVTAYLTEWDDSLALNPACQSFRVIISKDFGITRKAACEKTMQCYQRSGNHNLRWPTELLDFIRERDLRSRPLPTSC